MIVHVLTLFPGLFEAFLAESIVGRAVESEFLSVDLVNFRDFAEGKHRVVDDRPFGGGPGMVLKPEPIFAAVEHVLDRSERKDQKLLLLTPQGRPFDQEKAIELSREEEFTLLCGRYEGIDERVHAGLPWEEISLGDFVLSGGELASMCVIEAAIRLVPGVLGHDESATRDALMNGLLGPPQYTRPRVFRGHEVPEVLISGDHAAIDAWRAEQSLRRTESKRPELVRPASNRQAERRQAAPEGRQATTEGPAQASGTEAIKDNGEHDHEHDS